MMKPNFVACITEGFQAFERYYNINAKAVSLRDMGAWKLNKDWLVRLKAAFQQYFCDTLVASCSWGIATRIKPV